MPVWQSISKMDVALLFSLYPPNVGGCAVYSDILIRGMDADDRVRSVWFLTEYSGGSKLIDSTRKAKILRFLPPRDSRPRRHLLAHALLFVINQIFIALFLTLFRLLSSKNRVVHIHNRYGRRWVGVYCRLIGLPAVLDVRDRFYLETGLPVFDKIICASESIQNDLQQRGLENKLISIPVPMDLDEVQSFLKCEPLISQPYILFVGAMTESKGVFRLIQAYCSSLLPEMNTRLVLVGPKNTTNLEERLEFEGVEYLGPKPRHDVLCIIRHAALLVLPSNAEGMPRVALEAIALGVPVILPEGVGDFEEHCPQCLLKDNSVENLTAMLGSPFHEFVPDAFPIHLYSSSGYMGKVIEFVYRKGQ